MVQIHYHLKFVWNIAKWEGTRFWYEHSKVQILLFQNKSLSSNWLGRHSFTVKTWVQIPLRMYKKINIFKEEWLSGLKRRFAKPLYRYLYRRFESFFLY